jgi:hypothetical protein
VDHGFGTLGGVALDLAGNAVGLTCGHVAYGVPPTQPAGAQQLTVTVTGGPAVPVGPLLPGTTGNGMTPPVLVDAAAVPLPAGAAPGQIEGIGTVRLGDDDDVDGLPDHCLVRKQGARSGLTAAYRTNRSTQIYAVYDTDPTQFVFPDVWEIGPAVGGGPFARPGDSGSVVVAAIGRESVAVGVVFAVNEGTGLTYVTPMTRITAKLGVDINS